MVIALVVTCLPVRRSSGQRSAPDGAQRLRLFHGNLLYYNGRTAELGRVVHRLDADVLAFTEYTPTHAGGLYVSPLGQAFPYRIEHPEAKAGGSALWSRFPLTEISPPPAMYQSTAARVDAAGGLTVYVVHPPNPLDHLHHWRDELHGLAGLYDAHDPPAIVIGDLNATYWHPPFRRIQTAGWRDAHQVTGKGFSGSWPADRAWLPPILRIDHALVDDSLVVADVTDVVLPGSDHRGFVVTVDVSPTAPEGRAARSRSLRKATDGSRAASSPRHEPAARTTSPGSTAGSPSPPPDR